MLKQFLDWILLSAFRSSIASLLVFGVVVTPFVVVYHKGFEIGYRRGYSQSLKDNPPHVDGNYYAGEKLPFFLFKFGVFRLGI